MPGASAMRDITSKADAPKVRKRFISETVRAEMTKDQKRTVIHRIGQGKPVFAYKLIARRTVEEKIMQLQADKQALANQLYAEKRTSSLQLSSADLETLFAP